MANFIVYDTQTGEILRTGSCPDSMVEIQATQEGTAVIQASADPVKQFVDIDTKEITAKSDTEQLEDEYQNVKNQIPDLSDINDISDATLNSRIEEFYYSQVTAATWRLERYATLRKSAYSTLADRADASVKLSSGDEDLIAEGQSQLDALNVHDLYVKVRFPKG